MNNLEGQVALVTAGSRGLGAAIVLHLAKQGADVAFTYLENREMAEQVVAQVESMGRRSVAFQANAAAFDRAQEVVRDTIEKLGALHVLVCNAGIARGVRLVDMTETDWDTVVDVTLKGSFNYIRAVGPTFQAQNQGKIVCIGSINGLRGRMGTTSYNVAKAGLTGLVKTAASEMGRYNINVNLIAPGFIETPSQIRTPELIRDLVLKECAIKRLGTPEDIAPAVVFLCSPEARHITGEVIKVDAGQYL